MKTRQVRCSFVIPIKVGDDISEDRLRFMIEDNGCPGTGKVGSALRKLIEECDEVNVCWACKLGGENELLQA